MPQGKEELARSTLVLKERRDLAGFGLLFIAVAIFLFLFLSYQLVFMAYAILSMFIFSSYLMIWLEKGRERPVAKPARWPFVSVIIPSYNSKRSIMACVEACKAMEYAGGKEIIVVDDRSVDGSYEELGKIPGIRLFRKEKNAGKAAALNFGIARAKGEIFACVDSDTYPQKNTLSEAVPHFYERKNVGSVVVFIQAEKPRNLLQAIQEVEYWLSFGFFFRVIAAIDGVYVTPGPTALYRREMFEKLGGYDEKNICEDLEIALRMQRAGYRIAATHDTFVLTETPDTLAKLFKQRLRWYRGGLANMINYIDLFFNPKYGELSFFVLPTMLGSGLFAALFMGWMLLVWARNLLDWLLPFTYNFSGGVALTAITIGNGLITIHSGWLLWLFALFLWAFFMLKSFELAGVKPKLSHVLPLLCMLSIYPVFISAVFLISYLAELFGAKYSW